MDLLLIGAGFNADAAREAGPVYGQSINEGRYLIDCGYPLVADVAALCFRLTQAPSDKSIEQLFAEAMERNDYDPLEKLADRLMEADFRLANQLASVNSTNCYLEFFERFEKANFLTFNYDSLPEILLHRRQRWYPHDGYGVPVQVELQPLSPLSKRTDLRSTSLVLHLHGSFCLWTAEFQTEHTSDQRISWLVPSVQPSHKFDPDAISACFPAYRRILPELGYVPVEQRVIAPVPDKTESLKGAFIRETYSKAFPLVTASGHLIAVGYSFNANDKSSFHPILEALSASEQRNLSIVAPDSKSVAARIANEYPNIRVQPIEKTLKVWAMESFQL